jgi:hypothetical protein
LLLWLWLSGLRTNLPAERVKHSRRKSCVGVKDPSCHLVVKVVVVVVVELMVLVFATVLNVVLDVFLR